MTTHGDELPWRCPFYARGYERGWRSPDAAECDVPEEPRYARGWRDGHEARLTLVRLRAARAETEAKRAAAQAETRHRDIAAARLAAKMRRDLNRKQVPQ